MVSSLEPKVETWVKRIKNLLKTIGGNSLDTYVWNYVQFNDTPQSTCQKITESGQPHFGSPLPQASGRTPPQISQSQQSHTSESALPHTSKSAQPNNPQPAQPHTSKFEPERVPPKKGKRSNHYWFVDTIILILFFVSFHLITFNIDTLMYLYLIDEHEVTQKMKLKDRDAHNLPTRLRVVINYDDKFQPIGEACGLLSRVCGQLVGNHILFPRSFESWSFMPDIYKDTVWESAMKVIDTTFNTTLNMYILISFFQYICRLTIVLFEDSFLLQGT